MAAHTHIPETSQHIPQIQRNPNTHSQGHSKTYPTHTHTQSQRHPTHTHISETTPTHTHSFEETPTHSQGHPNTHRENLTYLHSQSQRHPNNIQSGIPQYTHSSKGTPTTLTGTPQHTPTPMVPGTHQTHLHPWFQGHPTHTHSQPRRSQPQYKGTVWAIDRQWGTYSPAPHCPPIEVRHTPAAPEV